jgi:hypothetical protein
MTNPYFIDVSNVKIVSFLEEGCIPAQLTDEHYVIYLWNKNGESTFKTGELTSLNKYSSIEDAFRTSYAAASRYLLGKNEQIIVKSFFISKIKNGQKSKFDDGFRKKINLYHRNDPVKYPFYCPGRDGSDNSERIESFNYEMHYDLFEHIFSDFVNEVSSNKIPFSYRHDTQRINTEFVIDTTKNHNKALFNLHTGGGKTTLTPHMVTSICEVGQIALFTTPIVDTLNDLIAKIESYKYSKPIAVITDNDLYVSENELIDNINSLKKNNVVMIALSVQNLRYEDETQSKGDIRKKFNFLKKLNITLGIRDEYHFQYNGEKTSVTFSNIKTKYTIDLTATTYKLMDKYSHLYNSKQIVSKDIYWALTEKKNGNVDYQNFPDFSIRSLDFNSSILSSELKSFYSTSDEFNGVKQFEVNNGNFVHENTLVELFNLMINSRHHSGHIISENKNVFYIFRSELPVKELAFIKLPQGNAEYPAQVRCEMLKNLLSTKVKGAYYKTATEFKDQQNRGLTKEEILSSWKEEAHSLGYTNTVIITHDQLCVGSDLVPLSIIVMFDNVTSPDLFLQISGRGMRVYPNKSKVLMFLMVPGMEINVSRMIYQNVKDKSNDPVVQKELFDCIPITSYSNGNLNQISFEEAIKNTHNYHLMIMNGGIVSSDAFSSFNSIPEFNTIVQKYSNLDKLGKIISAKDILNDSNNSKTNKSTKKDNNSSNNKNKLSAETRINKILSTMFTMVMPIVIMENHKTFDTVWYGSLVSKLFANDYIKLVHDILKINEVSVVFNGHFNPIISQINDLEMEEIILNGNWFVNQQFLSNTGLEWVKKSLSEKMIEILKIDKNVKNVCVINALNGTFPFLLKKNYPNVNVVCVEYFDYFKNHLKSQGFNVVNSLDETTHKFDAIIFDCKSIVNLKGVSNKSEWNNRLDQTIKLLNTNGKIVGLFDKTLRSLNIRTSKTLCKNINKIEYLQEVDNNDCIFLYNHSKRNNVTTFVKNDIAFESNLNKLPVIPNSFDKEAITVFEKISDLKKISKFRRHQTHHTKHINSSTNNGILMSDNKTQTNIYKLVRSTNNGSVKEVCWSNSPHKEQFVNKLGFSRGDKHPQLTFVDAGVGVIHDIIYISENDGFDFNTIQKLFSSKLYGFLINFSRFTNFNEENILNKILPYIKINNTVVDIDEYLYDTLNLSDEEVNYVNKNYRKK